MVNVIKHLLRQNLFLKLMKLLDYLQFYFYNNAKCQIFKKEGLSLNGTSLIAKDEIIGTNQANIFFYPQWC